MDLGTWVSVGSLLTVGVALAGIVLSGNRRLEDRLSARIDRVDERIGRVDDRIDRVEQRIDRLDERIGRLDDRVYGLAVGLKPLVDEARSRGPAA